MSVFIFCRYLVFTWRISKAAAMELCISNCSYATMKAVKLVIGGGMELSFGEVIPELESLKIGTLKYGVPQDSIFGPLLFLLHVNDLSQLLSHAGSYLYANDIFYQHEDVKKIENVLNKEFSSLCQWFIDNKLSINFGEDKTKSILFSKTRGLKEINISFAGNSIKQHETVEYLGCQLDSKLS